MTGGDQDAPGGAKGGTGAAGRDRRQADSGGTPGRNGPNRGPAGGRRHQGRILALQVLYELDVSGHDIDEVLTRTFAEQSPSASIRAHVERLVRGVIEDREAIDPHIAAAAPAFPIAQLPAVDRNVLRLAVFELLKEPEVPTKAAINEAVELAKRFGGETSSRFVNGVLGTVAGRVERDRPQPEASPAEGG